MVYDFMTSFKKTVLPRRVSERPALFQTPTVTDGFTLLEMMVVITIITVIIGVVVANQRSFDNSVILSSTAYDVALSVRQAQAYGGAGHRVSGTSPVNYGIGIDFNITQKNKYTIFADTYTSPSNSSCYSASNGSVNAPTNSPAQKSGDCVYISSTGGGSDQILRTFTINNGITISKLCYKPNTGSTNCVTPKTANGSFNQIDITYSRGEVINHIKYSSAGSSSGNSTQTCIELTSPDNSVHEAITVTDAGTIFVKRSTCL